MNNMEDNTPARGAKVVDRKVLLPFVLITSLFALWGFANDLTNPMVAAFQTIMEISFLTLLNLMEPHKNF